MPNPDHDKSVDFQKRAIDLLANKFLADHAKVRSLGEEIEHFYEVWSRANIREISLRGEVWKAVIARLRCM